MSFEGTTAHGTTTPKQEASEKEQLLVDISNHGKDLDSIKENIAKAQQEEVDAINAADQAKVANTKLQSEITVLQQQIGTLVKEKTSLQADIVGLNDLKLQKDNVESEIKAKSIELDKVNIDLDTAHTNKIQADQALAVIEDKVKAENEAFNKLTADHIAAKTELGSVYESMKTSHNKEISELSDKADTLKTDIIAKTSVLSEIQTAHTTLKTNHDDLVLRSSTLQADYDSKKAALDKELADKKVASDAKEAELVTREGDVSLKESHLKTSTDALRKAKGLIEASTGSRININI